MLTRNKSSDSFGCEVKSSGQKIQKDSIIAQNKWCVECRGKDSLLKWVAIIKHNEVK